MICGTIKNGNGGVKKMSCKSSKNWMMTALVAGAGAISVASLAGMAGVMSMEKMNNGRSHHQIVGMKKSNMMNDMGHRMACMSNEFADEFCMMAHKTGNAMIKCGRMINRMIP